MVRTGRSPPRPWHKGMPLTRRALPPRPRLLPKAPSANTSTGGVGPPTTGGTFSPVQFTETALWGLSLCSSHTPVFQSREGGAPLSMAQVLLPRGEAHPLTYTLFWRRGKRRAGTGMGGRRAGPQLLSETSQAETVHSHTKKGVCLALPPTGYGTKTVTGAGMGKGQA